MLKFKKSAFKHRITRSSILHVLSNKWGMTRWFKIHDHDEGYSQDMVVGFDNEGTFLEIGITYCEQDTLIFHADKVSILWTKKYVEEK